jgi:hypothetical protein
MAPSDAPRWQRAALAVLVVIYVGHATRYGDWMIDDAGITFGYARNLAAGNGPVINVGSAPVEGYSNPSWTFLLAITYAVGGFVWPWTPKILSGLANVAAMWLAWRASRRAWGEPSSPAHLLAPLLMALVPSFVKYTMSGLENGVFVFSIVAALEAQLREREKPGWWGGFASFLTALGRPEGIAYVAVLGLDRVVTAARMRDAGGLWRWAVAFSAPFGLYAAWHAVTFADWLPNTYYAKVRAERDLDEILSPHGRTYKYVRDVFGDHQLHWALAASLATLLAPRRWLDASGLALYGALGVALTFPIYAGGDWMPQHRLYSPMYPLLALAAAGAFTLPFLRRAPMVRTVLPVVAMIFTVATVPPALTRAMDTLGMRLDVQMKVLEGYGKWADQLGLDSVIVGLADVGGSSMTTTPRFEIVDLNGLIDYDIAHLRRELIGTGPGPVQDYIFKQKRPHFLNYPEAVYKLYQLADLPAAREDWWLFAGQDAQGRFGTFVRRDLVEGALPAELVATPVATGVRAAGRIDGGTVELWWLADAAATATPQVSLVFADATGARLRADTVKPFGGVFGWRLFVPGRVLHEVWRGTPPSGAVSVSVEPVAGANVQLTAPPTAPEAGAGTAVAADEGEPIDVPAGAVLAEGSLVDGSFEGDGSAWTSLPAGATGWAIEPDGDGHVLRVDFGVKGPLVCGPWAPLPPVLQVAGRVRAEGVVAGDKPWKTGAMTLRVKRADNTQHFPTLRTFDGTFDWKPVRAEYTAAPTDAQYRFCVGSTGGTGRMWVDDLGIVPA